MSVHYKFKSAISYDTITFDGLHISVRDLKKAILHQKQIGKNTDFDLQVTNAQTNEEYTDDQTLIPKNTSLIVSRIPLTTQQKKAWERAEQNNQLVLSKQILNLDSHEPDSAKLKGADLLGSNASEEDKINAMMAQSTQEYDPSNFVKIRGGNQYGEVPLNYVCHRCHNPGHWIKNCPNNNTTADPIDIKKATGIPRGFLVPVDGPSVPGAMLTGLGTFAVPSIDQEAYKQSMKPQKKQETEVEKVIIPEDLLCTLCSDLLTDAIMMPCCGTSFCDECIRNALLESEENECPDCHGKEISPETLIPNRYLRNAVNSFKDKTGYSKRIEAAKEKITQSKEPQASIPKINIQPPKEEVIIPVSTQSPPSDPSIEESKDEIYQKIAAVGDPIDKTQHNYSAIGTINNNSHNHSTFKTSQPQVQSQVPPVSVNNNSRPNNTNVYIPVNPFQNTRHTVTKSTDNRGQHIARYNSQSLSIPPHPHMRPCLPVGPADISVPPPPFAHPPPSIQSDGYNQMQPIHNPPPPGLDRNNSPANASSDEGMHPPESNRHQMDKFDNQTGPHQAMMRTGYLPGYYPPPPMSNYDPYNMPVDMRSRGYHRGYSRRPTRGQPMGSNYRPDYRNGGNYMNNKRTIDDPLAVFQRILRERDSKRRDMRVRHSMSRSRSRSLSRSRSRERSRSLSRSPSRIMNHRTRSISRSPLLRNRSITPRRRSRTRSRSPVRKRKKSLSPVKRLPVKSRRRTRSPSRDVQGRRSRSLSLHRRTRSRSRSLTNRNRMSPSPRFRSRSPSFYSSPARFNNYHREDENFGPKGGNWRGRGTWNNKGISQPYQQSHRFRGQFEGNYEVGVDRSTDYTNNYAQFDPHYAMDPNLVRDWDEIRDKEIREREKEKKEEEDKQKKKSKSQSPVKHHKLEKQRQEHKPSPEKNHKDSDKKDKGKRKKKKDVDLDKKKKKKSREKKEKDDSKKGDEKENKISESDIKLEIEGANQINQEPAAPGTSESPLPFESVAVKEEVIIKNFPDVSDGLYGDLDEVAPVDTSWGSFKITEETDTFMKSKEETLGDTVEEKPKEPEVLAELPERSKWEVEEDTNTIDDKFDVEKQKEGNLVDNSESHNDSNQVSVTNEVLKRAENAIFQKTVRTIDVSGKKTVVDKSEGIKDKKPDIIRDKKIESEKHLSKEKKPDSVKERKSEVSKDKKIECVKEKKIDTSRDKKVDNVKDKKQDIVKDKKHDVSKDSKDKKTDVDKDKRPDVKDKKLENVKDRKTDRERRSNDKLSETKTVPEKSSRRDEYVSKHKDKKNLESDTAADSLSIQREARKSGHSIQITIPSDLLDDKKNKDGAKRISAKDRLGDKVEDKDDKHYKSRNEKRKVSRSRSPVRVHSTLIVPEPPPRKVRVSPKTRRDSLKKDRNAKTERTTSSNRPSRRDDEKKSVQQKKTETRRIVRPDEKHHRTVEHKNVSKKEDRLEKKEVKKKEEKREEVVKKLKPKEKETEKKERKNRRLEPDRKVCDERFDNNDEEEIKKLPKDKESDDSMSSSSSSSSSSDSSPVRSKKRKKTKKRKKKHVKKKKLASSSDSDDSSSSSESDDANSSKHKKKKKKDQRKHKVHKKPLKKKKKTKHR